MSKPDKKNPCPKGQIMRKGYIKKGYRRKEYIKKDGTRITAADVPGTKVDPVCIIDRGRPGYGPKTLPRPDDVIHLHHYGYSAKKSVDERQEALRKAAADTDVLLILRRLNLLRNYQSVPKIKDIFSNDVEYMKKLYEKERSKNCCPKPNY